MKVLVACEFSGAVREAFRAQGHDAWSCDLLPAEDDSPYHIQGDVLNVLDQEWDLMIAHPPCTYLTVSGARWLYHPDDKHLPVSMRRPHPKHPDRLRLKQEALDFVQALMDAPIPHIAIENPVSMISSGIRPADQKFQPYHFGHLERKSTCLWLKNLPLLKHTSDLEDETMALPPAIRDRIHLMPPSEDRWKMRSVTFQGIADAMANQWGGLGWL
tara:strand:+ start:900 stop:1544 length:645 start_codon:yes stop_codon:yes gene_type:complete